MRFFGFSIYLFLCGLVFSMLWSGCRGGNAIESFPSHLEPGNIPRTIEKYLYGDAPGEKSRCRENKDCLTGVCDYLVCKGLLSSDSLWIQRIVAKKINSDMKRSEVFEQELMSRLIEILSDTKADIFHRSRVVRFLGEIEATEAKQILLVAVGSDNKVIQTTALLSLARYNDVSVVQPLGALFLDKNTNPHLKLEIIRALGFVRHPSVLPYVEGALYDGNYHIQLRALEALENLGLPETVPILISILRGTNELLKFGAAQALFKSTGKYYSIGVSELRAPTRKLDIRQRAGVDE